MINDCLSEIIGPFPVPPPRDKRERNDDPGQKGRGHRYSVHPSNHTVSIDYRDRRSVNYLDHSHCAILGVIIGTVAGSVAGLIGSLRSPALTSTTGLEASGTHVAGSEQGNGSALSRPARRGFLRRLLRWISALAICWLLACFWLGAHVRKGVDRRLASAIAAADRDDPFWRLDDLMAHREPVADKENAALAVSQATEFFPREWPEGYASRPAAAARSGTNPPGPSLSRAAEAFDALMASPDNRLLDETTAATLRRELEKSRRAVQIAQKVAGLARGRHEIKFGRALIDTQLDETQQARTVARLLLADAAIRAQDKDLEGALESSRAVLGVSRSIGDEPFLISQLVRIAIGEQALQSARRVLAQGEVSDDALTRLQTDVATELTAVRLLGGLKAERAVNFEVMRRICEGELPFTAPLAAPSPGWQTLNLSDLQAPISSFGKLYLDNDRAALLEWLNEAVAIARRPPPARASRWRAWDASVFKQRSRIGDVNTTLPIALLHPLSAAGAADSQFDSELRATQILLAAERQRLKTGIWPASVAAIHREILSVAPTDVFSGHEFRMEHRDGQLDVYSIGPNGKDEHGAFDPKTHLEGGPDDFGTSA